MLYNLGFPSLAFKGSWAIVSKQAKSLKLKQERFFLKFPDKSLSNLYHCKAEQVQEKYRVNDSYQAGCRPDILKNTPTIHSPLFHPKAWEEWGIPSSIFLSFTAISKAKLLTPQGVASLLFSDTDPVSDAADQVWSMAKLRLRASGKIL